MSTIVRLQTSAGRSTSLRSGITTSFIVVGGAIALHIGQTVFAPFGLAILLTFALAPFVGALRGLRFGRVLSVVVAVSIAAAIVGALVMFVTAQFAELAAHATPHHVSGSPEAMMAALRIPPPVWIASALIEPLTNPLTSAGIAVLFTAFLLLNKESLAKQIAHFAKPGDTLDRHSEIGEAAGNFSRYLLLQGLMDLGFGVLVASGLWYIGVPTPGLWALLGVMLRSVPFVGVPIAAACPLMLAISMDPTTLLVCETLLLFLVIDFAIRAVERRILRVAFVRLSTATAIGAMIVWTGLWGMTGLLLALPLTLGLAMLGQYFAPLQFLGKLLSSPSTDRPRSEDSRETAAKSGGKAKTIANADGTMQALLQAQRELSEGQFGPAQRAHVLTIVDAMTNGSITAIGPRRGGTMLALRPWNLAPHWQQDAVLCVAGPGAMDEAATILLVQSLKQRGLNSRIVRFDDMSPANLPRVGLSGVQIICFSCLDPRDRGSLRQLVRRVRPHASTACLIAGLWGWAGDDLIDAHAMECDLVATHPQEAANQIARMARKASASRPAAKPGLDFAPVALAA